ncbi:MAG: 2-C-methyl-D-erythritol 2,4-cyclodiphosphate synthase, partial [Pseudomonadota bacterium]
QFLTYARDQVLERGYAVANVDVTLVCEAPKIGPHRAVMIKRLSDLLGTEEARISVKATTSEGLGFTGRGEGIACQAVASIVGVG